MGFSNSDGRATIFGSCPGAARGPGKCHLAQGILHGPSTWGANKELRYSGNFRITDES